MNALLELRDASVRIAILTNGSVDSTKKLLGRGNLSELVDEVMSCDEVHRFKPDPAPYELAVRRVGSRPMMVAAHGWDIAGARSAGLDAIWIDREERNWPFPLDPPPRRTTSSAPRGCSSTPARRSSRARNDSEGDSRRPRDEAASGVGSFGGFLGTRGYGWNRGRVRGTVAFPRSDSGLCADLFSLGRAHRREQGPRVDRPHAEE